MRWIAAISSAVIRLLALRGLTPVSEDCFGRCPFDLDLADPAGHHRGVSSSVDGGPVAGQLRNAVANRSSRCCRRRIGWSASSWAAVSCSIVGEPAPVVGDPVRVLALHLAVTDLIDDTGAKRQAAVEFARQHAQYRTDQPGGFPGDFGLETAGTINAAGTLTGADQENWPTPRLTHSSAQ